MSVSRGLAGVSTYAPGWEREIFRAFVEIFYMSLWEYGFLRRLVFAKAMNKRRYFIFQE
jgi:hypothetical protein